ncbi:hypothetical protein E4P39_04670 [Blastococcus sp. CT_GayMR19]|uniref:hypothetical protein n=1 Tax=Blastococcus sp. CT_GayMR19 TaxID=2559608 RepID=UPI0010742369|nr:hypothetical protein [Blastococcus sp. CT_GayMR19]TFV78487.1 hypothetical protein E4P39_04670 [Blastococcus sp. CT_GayMR19]
MTFPPADPWVARLERFLAEGMPAPPPRMPVAVDEIVEVPLAVWQQGDVAAVLWVERERNSDEVDARVDTFVNAGRWQLASSGGGSWLGDLDAPIPSGVVAIMGLTSELRSPSTGGCYGLVGGRVGRDVTAVGYRGPDRRGIVPVVSPIGAFLVGIEIPAAFGIGPIRSLDGPTDSVLDAMPIQWPLVWGLTPETGPFPKRPDCP